MACMTLCIPLVEHCEGSSIMATSRPSRVLRRVLPLAVTLQLAILLVPAGLGWVRPGYERRAISNPCRPGRRPWQRLPPRNALSSADVVTPIGPFCPFRSEACRLDGMTGMGMGELSKDAPEFATEMARMQFEFQMGQEPDKDRVRFLAGELEKSYKNWEMLLGRLQLSDDFQSREYFMLTQTHLARQGKKVTDVGGVVKHQIAMMRAFANNEPPPMPPPDVDLSAPTQGSPASMSPPSITADPFDGKEDFGSDIVNKEYVELCRDHSQLIKLGEQYGTFDPLGKIAFLDQLERIEERWDVFYGRSALMGELSLEFRHQSEEFLTAMGLGAGEFRKLLEQTHQTMRQRAEEERALG
eukprot:TRINITY_DN74810_c0_g1_i1.p1 TRINITY_DN74810_c0_g1~~TRINITY_DN74810_c0_g1_i1.p1  ORF type:complete len:374 (-),score=29.12 TRINITY_DN74810_c0_g1_i1:6-1073(-)